MKPMAQIPRSAGERKPPHGSPCNRCGVCCMAVPCTLAKKVLGQEKGRCAALVQLTQHEFICGMVLAPGLFAPQVVSKWGRGAAAAAAHVLIGAATGCDARINGEPANQEFYQFLSELDVKMAHQIKAAKTIWFGEDE